MTAESARLLLGRRQTKTSSAMVSGFLPSVMERIHCSDIGLVIWRRFTRLNLLVSASSVLMGQPFTLTVTDTPDVAARRLCRELTLFHWPLYGDFRRLARRFSALAASSVVRMRLEHVIDDSCRTFHVDAVGLRLLSTYAGSRCRWGKFDVHGLGAVAMGRASLHAISPAGLIIDKATSEADHLLIVVHPTALDAACTACGKRSSQIHSRYQRRLLDLPSQGRPVRLQVRVRRFRCGNAGCARKIFGEVLGDDVAPKAARRTSRLEAIVHHIGIALGGRPAASLARRLMLPVSRDTLLRVVRRRAMASGTAPISIVGIDDFAWKRGQRYGTVVCDLERRRVIDLLPDREATTVAAWLAGHPEITVVSRDRGGGYGQAATQGAPQAVQVADRWHLMENASAAFLDAVRRSMPLIRQALASSEIDPALLTAAERIQHDGFLRRRQNNRVVWDLARTGVPIKEIARQTGRSRKLVRSVLRGEDGDVFRCRSSTLDDHLGNLEAAWDGGCRNGAELWRRLRADGFKGGLRVVTEWATRRRRNEKAGQKSGGPPPARTLSHLMTMRRERLTKAQAVTVAGVEAGVPALAAARKMLDRFHRMIRNRNAAALTSWLADSETGLLASFCKGIRADLAAVTAALTEPWSNGQTEGQITRLKLVKRQMYGRAGLDLLRARLIGVA